ncbi:MAG TPA: hypothetical protein VMA37_11865 [Acetobacteraceae bacterium]|nr:hypothetical protein [Acetobacteraceae bacterium]
MSAAHREVVAVFDTAEALEGAIFGLETHGFDRAAFSVLASEHEVERSLGHRFRRVEEMEDEPKAPRETFFSRVSRVEAEFGLAPGLALIGAVAFGLGSAPIALPMLVAAGSGAAIGAVLGRLIHQHHAERLSEQLARGGLVLWVNVRNADEEHKAMAALRLSGARDVHAHDLAP